MKIPSVTHQNNLGSSAVAHKSFIYLVLLALFTGLLTQAGCIGLAKSAAATAPASSTTSQPTSGAPSITAQPVGQAVAVGQTATFSVAATGTAPLTYQWQKNGMPIAGATSASYTTPAVAAADNGSRFVVVVGNTTGNATSGTASLTVNATSGQLTSSTSALAFGSVTTGSNSVLAVSFTNSSSSNIAIANVSISGPGFSATGGGLSSGLIIAPAQTATLNVTFAPASTGAVRGALTVTSNAANSTASVSLSGSGAQATSQSAILSWSPGASVMGYNVYRSAISDGPYSMVNSAMVTATQYTDATVQGGQTYYYVVTSVNSSDVDSAYSTQVAAAIPSN